MSTTTPVALEPVAMKPITIGPYRLTNTGLEVHGRPSLLEHQTCGDFITRVEKASSWWAADWIAYGETRTDWADAIEHLVDSEEFTEGTVRQYRYIAKNIPPSRRLDGVSFSVHSEVASLDAEEQKLWLERAKVEKWSQRQIRAEIRAEKRTKTVTGKADGIYEIEVVLFLDVEADSLDKAEAIGGRAIKKLIKGVGSELLTIKVAHVRPR